MTKEITTQSLLFYTSGGGGPDLKLCVDSEDEARGDADSYGGWE